MIVIGLDHYVSDNCGRMWRRGPRVGLLPCSVRLPTWRRGLPWLVVPSSSTATLPCLPSSCTTSGLAWCTQRASASFVLWLRRNILASVAYWSRDLRSWFLLITEEFHQSPEGEWPHTIMYPILEPAQRLSCFQVGRQSRNWAWQEAHDSVSIPAKTLQLSWRGPLCDERPSRRCWGLLSAQPGCPGFSWEQVHSVCPDCQWRCCAASCGDHADGQLCCEKRLGVLLEYGRGISASGFWLWRGEVHHFLNIWSQKRNVLTVER